MRKKRARFDMSHINSTTTKMGLIVPIMLAECLPGDTWQGDNKIFTRVAPLVAPVMHKVRQDVYTFFVSNRLLWQNWENFITGGKDGTDASEPPYLMLRVEQGTLGDHFGLPLSNNTLRVSALPFRAYNLIYNEYFRDQDLQDEVTVLTSDGFDNQTPSNLIKANWAKDYFTTARPWPQKGNAVNIPIGDLAKVDFYYHDEILADKIHTHSEERQNGSGQYFMTTDWYRNGVPIRDEAWMDAYADLSNASTVTIDELRQAFAIQRWQEKRSLFGSRYEDLLHFWGLSTQDYRLQRPELVSVRNSLLQFSEVLQTSPNSSGNGVGEMSGHGVGAMRSGRWRYYCHEHGFLISLLVVRPQAVYTQGIERMWTRNTRWDYWNPEFQHIGQQEVYQREIFADGSENDGIIFGYQNRFDEYRRGKNHVSGEFRTTLDYWNMARIFDNAPSLNSEFITSSPTDRIYQIAGTHADHLYIMIQNDLLVKRLVSRNGNPI